MLRSGLWVPADRLQRGRAQLSAECCKALVRRFFRYKLLQRGRAQLSAEWGAIQTGAPLPRRGFNGAALN